jgi:hypothetical protein
MIMTRDLKALGLALLAVLGLLALTGKATAHELHSENEKTILTGRDFYVEKIAIGAAGTVECKKTEFESTQTGAFVSSETYASNTITLTPRYSECTFGGKAATINFSHCAYIFYTDTTEGHANIEIECSEGGKIEIETSICTATIGPQLIKHAISYENTSWAVFMATATAKSIVTSKAKTTESQTGCLLFPTGAIGTYTGTPTIECLVDSGSALTETAKTTPQGNTTESAITSDCNL